jgi:hypothetical protein
MLTCLYLMRLTRWILLRQWQAVLAADHQLAEVLLEVESRLEEPLKLPDQ